MPKYKYKFLVFQTKVKEAFGLNDIVAQKEVTGLDKFEIGKKWGELEQKYPKENFQSCLTETNNHLREFEDDPKKWIS